MDYSVLCLRLARINKFVSLILLNFVRGTKTSESTHFGESRTKGGGVKANLASAFVPGFRFRWLPSEWLSLPYPTPIEFIYKVNELLADEEEWQSKGTT